MKRAALGLATILVTFTTCGIAGAWAQASGLPVYQYKRFCQDLAKGHAVMARNCESQEVLSYDQLRRIWQDPPSETIQDKCNASNVPNRRTGSGSYVKFLNCIVTNTGNG
jgi:hypothetical protein